MAERRKFIRFKVLLKGEIEIKAKRGITLPVQVLDFSREGTKLLIPLTSLLGESLLALNIYLPNRQTPIFIQGRIKRIRPVEDYVEVGVKIDSLNPIDKSEILDFAYKKWKTAN